jgi:ParB family chromosome partitioning protein
MNNANFADLIGGLVEDSGEPEGARLKELPLAEIYEDPNNPRKTFDKREIEDLAASIRANTLLQPITVRPKDERGYMIRYGARRFRAAHLAGLERVAAIITTSDASEADILAAQVIENDQREGLNTEEMALAVARLQGLGLNQAQISEKLGRPKDQISMFAAVNDMPPTLRKLAPKLGVRTLYELFAAWKRDAVRTEALVSDKGEEITTAEARALSAELKASAKAAAAPKTAEPVASAAPANTSSEPADGPGGAGQGAESLDVQTPANDGAAPVASRSRRAAHGGFDVKVGKRNGHLLLEAGPDPETVMIAFDDGASIEPTPVSSVRLVRARSH